MGTGEVEIQESSDDSAALAGPAFAGHVQTRTVVLPELRIVFLPIPKGGCTSILWLLSELAGLQPEAFLHSTLPEVSPSLTIHDMSLWPEGLRLSDYEGDERKRVLLYLTYRGLLPVSIGDAGKAKVQGVFRVT